MWFALAALVLCAIIAGLRAQGRTLELPNWLLRKFAPQLSTTSLAQEAPQYKKLAFFFSKAERSFYEVLKLTVGNDWIIFAKVRLADVIQVSEGVEDWQRHFSRIARKHVDFLLCEPKNLAPQLVIELDDASHERPDRQERDAFMDAALKSADLPLLRVKCNHAYAPNELQSQILKMLSSKSEDPDEKYYRNCARG